MSSGEVRRLGIFGGGTVGGGIVEILGKKAEQFNTLAGGTNIEVAKICVRDANKERDFSIPEGCEIVTDYDAILTDDSIDMVVEVMGGTTDAKDVVFKAIKAKKDVVTANKALIAACLPEIEELLKTVNDNDSKDVEFKYEAAVCGGIPVIRSMQSDFVGDDISQICGIINGCTNFMLTAMDRNGQSYDDALKEASILGYAEADPTLDVGGFDARSKLKILMRLAYGVDVEEDEISCRGITELSKVDFEYAKMLGGTIKLVGVAKVDPSDHTRMAAYVSPAYITSEDTLAAVSGATNAVEIISSNLVQSTYIGQGAGRYPTANSCINDIVSLAKGDMNPTAFNPSSDAMKFVNDYESAFFIRLKYRDALGITRQCGEICEKHGVSIHSILQNPIASRDDAAFVLVTENVSLSSIKKVCAEVEGLDWCKGEAFFMPVLRNDAI
jgi:homoserine dehydrogenase